MVCHWSILIDLVRYGTSGCQSLWYTYMCGTCPLVFAQSTSSFQQDTSIDTLKWVSSCQSFNKVRSLDNVWTILAIIVRQCSTSALQISRLGHCYRIPTPKWRSGNNQVRACDHVWKFQHQKLGSCKTPAKGRMHWLPTSYPARGHNKNATCVWLPEIACTGRVASKCNGRVTGRSSVWSQCTGLEWMVFPGFRFPGFQHL